MPSSCQSTMNNRRGSKKMHVTFLCVVLALMIMPHNVQAFVSTTAKMMIPTTTTTTTTTSNALFATQPTDTTQTGTPQQSSSSSSSQPSQQAPTNDDNSQHDDDHHPIEAEPCNVVFTHTNADFDSLAAAVALSLLWSQHEDPTRPAHVVLPRGTHPSVQRFLAFHKHLLPLRGFKTIQAHDVHRIGLVDATSASRIGRGKAWLPHAASVHIYDHHDNDNVFVARDDQPSSSSSSSQQQQQEQQQQHQDDDDSLINTAAQVVIDKVGSTTTLLVERLKEANIIPQPHEATLFVLGIRADTGGLLYEGTTIRDAAALLWCLQQGASQTAIADFGNTKLTAHAQRDMLQTALRHTHTRTLHGVRISSVLLGASADHQYVAGLAQVCEDMMGLTDSHVFVLAATHRSGGGGGGKKKKSNKKPKDTTTTSDSDESLSQQWISLIGRANARAVGVDLNAVMTQFGGGGHAKAAAAALRCMADEPQDEKQQQQPNLPKPIHELVVHANRGELSARDVLSTAIDLINAQIPEQLVASSFMVPVSNIVTVTVDHTVAEARQIFDLHKLKSAPVVDVDADTDNGNMFRSSLKLNDLIKAIRAGRSTDKLKGMLRPDLKTVQPDTPMADVEYLLIHEGVGRIPVVDEDGALVGMVSRTDVLRQYKLYDGCLPA